MVVVLVLVGVVSAGALGYYFTLSNHNGEGLIPRIRQGVAPEIDYRVNLPEKPDNWGIIKREMEHKYMDISKMEKSYWIQPDFYPGWEYAEKFYTNHDYSRWGVYGTGAFPANLRLTVPQNELEVGIGYEFWTLYRAGYGVETYQGMKLISGRYSEYFDLVIEPNEFLLEPTFPVFSCNKTNPNPCDEDWVRPIKLTIVVKKIAPKGIYNFSVVTDAPGEEISREWYWNVLERETTQEERDMVAMCKVQQAAGEEMAAECKELILMGRKNRYMESQLFEAGNRVSMEVIVV